MIMATEIKIQGETVSQRPEKKQLDGTEELLIQDSEGTKKTKSSTLKTFVQPDLSEFAKKTELAKKVSGTGVTSIQVVTELPETQEDGVLYIVKEAEQTGGEETA